jgi:hypothetical protein
MNDSTAEPPPGGVVWDLDTGPVGAVIPRRVMRARREVAEALGSPFESPVPGWSVASASAYGSAVPLDDEIS